MKLTLLEADQRDQRKRERDSILLGYTPETVGLSGMHQAFSILWKKKSNTFWGNNEYLANMQQTVNHLPKDRRWSKDLDLRNAAIVKDEHVFLLSPWIADPLFYIYTSTCIYI